jgi:alpha,alpha-trehalase
VPPSRYRDWHPTPEFNDHQRAVRESGWDMTHRFGEHGHLTVPVCLNALLYGYERDLAEIHRRIDGAHSPDAARLDAAAAARRGRIDALLWDPARGLYFDWDMTRRARNDYEHVASFYALWVGLASNEQARAIVASLPLFETPGGVAVSSERSRRAAGGEDLQWDWPNGWAPLQVIAIEGLRRYGYAREADRLASHWLSMVLDQAGAFNGLIREKYDVVLRSADVSAAEYGNQGGDRGTLATYTPACRALAAPRPIACVALALPDPAHPRALGFGWTNASVDVLFPALGDDARAALERGDVSP